MNRKTTITLSTLALAAALAAAACDGRTDIGHCSPAGTGGGGGAGGDGTASSSSAGGGRPGEFGPACASADDCPPAGACSYADCKHAGAAGPTCVYFGFSEHAPCPLGDGGEGICLEGECKPGVPLNCLAPNPTGPVVCPACDDGDPCTVDSCVLGACHHAPVPDDAQAACSAPDAAPGSCKGGFCCFPH